MRQPLVWLVEEADRAPGVQDVRRCARRLGVPSRVALVDDERLGGSSPALRAEALRAVVASELEATDEDEGVAVLVVLPHTYRVAEYAPQLAVRLGAAYVPSVGSVTMDGPADGGKAVVRFRRAVLQGRLTAEVRARRPVVVATVQIGSFPGEDLPRPDDVVEVGRPADTNGLPEREVVGRESVSAGGVDLASAERIVTAGRGVGGAEEVSVAADLASAFDAELGASRPVVDNGWLPRERQVGSSGHVVTPQLYVALGVSGSIQHLMGMSGARVIVAINKDAEAPIFGVAHYGIVADLHEVAPELTRLLADRRRRQASAG